MKATFATTILLLALILTLSAQQGKPKVLENGIMEFPDEAPPEGVSENMPAPPPPERPKMVVETDSSKILAATITPKDIRKHLITLAGDEMEGRETGFPGQKKAAEYIAGHFKALGFDPVVDGSYFQKIFFAYNRWTFLGVEVNGEGFRYMWDYYGFPSANTHTSSIKADEVVFLGYGIEDEKYNDYEGVDVKGKVILIYPNEPLDKDSISRITGEKRYSEWSLNWKKKLMTAKKNGVKAVLFIEPNIKKNVSRYRDRLIRGHMSMGEEAAEKSDNYANAIYISRDVAKAIIGKKYYKKFIKKRNKILKKGSPQHLVVPCDLSLVMEKETSTIAGENVLGYLPGTDLKDELVVVSAHYDHLGKRGDDIYNGADDNGSGSSTVLDIAEAFSIAKEKGYGPRRSVLFLLVSGEEKGLLGSEYYVEFPIFPLENTIANVNVDMIGRVDEKHKDNPEYIYVIGADRLSTELHDINEKANSTYTNIELDYTFNAEDDPNRYYYRSDHYNFAEQGIPAVFYFSGVHEDYHRTSDTVEKILFDKTAKIGQLIFHTIWQLSNQDKRIEVNVGK